VFSTISQLNVSCSLCDFLGFSVFIFRLFFEGFGYVPLFLYFLSLLIYSEGVAVGDPSPLHLLPKKKLIGRKNM
jgi:hypothetical protein